MDWAGRAWRAGRARTGVAMSEMSIGKLRQTTGFMRGMTALVLLVYAADLLAPSAQAIAREAAQSQSRPAALAVAAPGVQKRSLGEALAATKEHLRVLSGRADAAHHGSSAGDRSASKAALGALR